MKITKYIRIKSSHKTISPIDYILLLILFISLNGVSPFVSNSFGQVQDIFKARKLERTEKLEDAANIYREIYIATGEIAALLGLERTLTSLNRFEELEAHLRNYLKRDSSQLGLKKSLVRCLFHQGKNGEAIHILFKMMDDGPANPAYIKSIANEFFSFSHYDMAIKIYQNARKKLKNNLIFDSELAFLYNLRQDYTNAIREYFNFLDREAYARSNVEYNILKMGKTQDEKNRVADILKIHVNMDIKNTNKWNIYCLYLYKNGMMERASEEYLRYSMRTGIPEVYFGYAKMCFADGLFDEAVKAYRIFLEQYESSSHAGRVWYDLGRALIELNRTEEAEEVFQVLFDKYSGRLESKWARLTLARQKLENSGDPLTIIGELELIEQNNIPHDLRYEITLLLGDAYLQAGKPDRAQWTYCQGYNLTRDKNRIQTLSYRLALVDYYNGDMASFDITSLDAIEEKLEKEHVNDIIELRLLVLEMGMDSPELIRLGHCEYLMAQKSFFAAAESLSVFLEAKPPHSAVDRAGLLLGHCFVELGKFDEALQVYENIIQTSEIQTVRERAFMAKAEVYEFHIRDIKKAVAQYEILISTSPNSIFAGEARRRIERISNDGGTKG